ncbi:MAG: glycosyltransferase family 2 protein [Candidatus Latescibacteria bacterium]|jgi:GT2 family glycosyltransferase|nr:glycosyltransferase family 2 protein [Candidatus Latescibacterota bacterium]
MEKILVATLLTCHNRKETTLACLKALYSQTGMEGVEVNTYLVDDGCTDGTGDAVREAFPGVRVLQGDGNLYWCGGMRFAWAEAMKENYDYYLWLNDDTLLFDNALRTMLDTAVTVRESHGQDGIVVGSTCDPDTGKQTYGGVQRIDKTLGFRLIEPSDKPQCCDTMNGNCVLISKAVARVTGNLSGRFTHAIGDTDYGLRACRDGFSCWIAAGYVGECRQNPRPDWTNPETPLRERLKNLRDPKGLPPGEWIEFAKRHAGWRWPLYAMKLWLRVLFPGIWKL